MSQSFIRRSTIFLAGVLVLLTIVFLPVASQAGPPGLVKIKSAYSVADTVDRFERELTTRNLTLMATIDHSAGASSVGLDLRPTRVLIFGNPRAGTPLMQCAQTVGIDLPMKALFWEDQRGQIWAGYNAPSYLKQRHQLQGCDPVIEKTNQTLKTLMQSATQP